MTESLSFQRLLQDTCRWLKDRGGGLTISEVSEQRTWIESEIPTLLQRYLPDGFSVKGSIGQGMVADTPWVGIFPPGSRASARFGYYLVYLFAADGSGVYLSLNQAVEQIQGGTNPIRKRTLDLRSAAGEQDGLLTTIRLRSSSSLPQKYELGNAYARMHRRDEIPEDEQLKRDLEQMLTLLRKVEESGLQFHSEIEPTHLLFKWSSDREARTVELHQEVAESKGSVWWGKFSTSSRSAMSASNIETINEQFKLGVPTYVFLHRAGETWRTSLKEITVDPSLVDRERLPDYYSTADCNLFVRISEFSKLDPNWAAQNLLLASDPVLTKTPGALSNQTTPLRVYELFTNESQQTSPTSDSEHALLVGAVRNRNHSEELADLVKQQGKVTSWWSYPLQPEKIQCLETWPFLYIYIGKPQQQLAFRFHILEHRTTSGSEGLESPWPEYTEEEYQGKTSAGSKKSELFKTWFLVDEVEQLNPPLGLGELQKVDGTAPEPSALINSFGLWQLKSDDAYKKALEKLRSLLDSTASQYRDEVIGRYQPIFSSASDLTKEDFHSFLLFDNNHHWTNLHRQSGAMCSDMNRLRTAVALLVDGKRPLATRFDAATSMVKGMGKNVATAILLMVYPDTCGVWNNRSEKSLKTLEILPVFSRGASRGQQYEQVNDLWNRLAKDLGIDLWTLDRLLGRVSEKPPSEEEVVQPGQGFDGLMEWLKGRGLHFSEELVSNYLLALQSKRFVILTGISGTGKTRLAKVVAEFFQPKNTGKQHYQVVAVRPDWTDNRGLLGYFNPLTDTYLQTPFLRLLLEAEKEQREAEQQNRPPHPFFVILDEMNLARVEHYFSDFLSCLESEEPLDLHNSKKPELEEDGVPQRLGIPKNLFFTGTVNVDETTYMFSPKVLDRAFTIELNEVDLRGYGTGFSSAQSGGFRLDRLSDSLELLERPDTEDWKNFSAKSHLINLNEILQQENRHFGYRVANEIARYVNLAKKQADDDEAVETALDLAILQKVLPKFHGMQQELEDILRRVLVFAVSGRIPEKADLEAFEKPESDESPPVPMFPRTAAKLKRMLTRLRQQGFTSYIE